MAKLKMTIIVSTENGAIWRATKEISKACAGRLEKEGYQKVIKKAEAELKAQLKQKDKEE